MADLCDSLATGTCAAAEGFQTRATGAASHAEGANTLAEGSTSHAEGFQTFASGAAAHTEGSNTVASNTAAHAEGFLSLASGEASHAEGLMTRATAAGAHAEGIGTNALANSAHAEGSNTSASSLYAHAEGNQTTASGMASHAEGENTLAAGLVAHAEGQGTIAQGEASHAEGDDTLALGRASHAQGNLTEASGSFAHAQGQRSVASGDLAHAEGNQTVASGQSSHAEGAITTASGFTSHAEGVNTVASGFFSHTQGQSTDANLLEGVHVMGQFGAANELSYSWYLANGMDASTPSLAAKILSDGNVKIDGTVSSPAADYAEMFESENGQPIGYGFFVALEEDKVRIAHDEDNYILGVTSAKPAFLSDSGEMRWKHKYVTTEWGEILYESVTLPAVQDPHGQVIIPERTERRPVLHPQWDPTLEYVPRTARKEWIAVGLLGKLLVRDNGLCVTNGYCKPDARGAATPSDNGYRVLKRISPQQILILFR
jgi:trimeric autotransporter adhesin